jgi:tetratricopeptide (TPR) repeat protein
MRNSPRQLAMLGTMSLLLVAAGEPPLVAERLRDANDAFERGEWETAELLYTQAEERSDDPGLVAFNKGAALYHRGDFRRAELCFRRCLGDAAIADGRRGRALYNLGNCLVRQAGESDVKLLQSAIECYELALRTGTDEGIQKDAGHNLEIAKLLWAKAKAKRPAGERDPEWDEAPDRKRPPEGPKPPQDPGPDGTNEGPKKADPSPKLELGKGPDAGTAPKETQKAAPGAGSLPVLPDNGTVESLAPEDARAALKKAGERLQRERRKLREEATQGERPRTNDW